MKKLLLTLLCLTSFTFANINEEKKIIQTIDNVGRYADEHKWGEWI